MSRFGRSANVLLDRRLDRWRPPGHSSCMDSLTSRRKRLGVHVARARKTANLATQEDLAKAADVATGIVGAIERGERKVSESSLTKIEVALNFELGSMAAYLAGQGPLPGEPHMPTVREADEFEPVPGEFADELEYLKAVVWFLRRKGMHHETIMRAIETITADYDQLAEEQAESTSTRNAGGPNG